MKILTTLLGSIIVAVLGLLLVTTTLAPFHIKIGSWGTKTFLIFWVIGIDIAFLTPSVAKAWRRLFFTSAILSFLLTLSTVLTQRSLITTSVDSSSKLTHYIGIIGLVLGVVFFIAGFSLGRGKKEDYVQAISPPKEQEDINDPVKQ